MRELAQPLQREALSVRWQSKRLQQAFWRIVALAIVLAGAVVVLIPFLWMLSTSLKTEIETYAFPPKWVPSKLVWRNYPEVLTILPFGLFFRNTAIITFSCMFGQVLSASLVAYGFARMRAPGRDLLFVILLGTMMLPGQVTIIPLYLLFHKLGWVNTFKPLIVPSFFGGGAFSIFLLRQFFMGIPPEMDDAAKIDGCSRFGIYWRLVLPLSYPALATVAIFSFMGHWNDFFAPLIYLNDLEKFTVSLGLSFFQGGVMMTGRLDQLMAASVTALLPCLIVFFTAQRLFIQGIVITGVKG